MENKQYFTIEEAVLDIKEVLERGYDGYLCELHNEAFNTDYYIIGTYQAKEALTQYGVFEAIDEIQEYEKEHFGEVYTDLASPEKVANMLYYLKGEEAMTLIQDNNSDFDDAWNDTVDDDLRKSLLETIEELLADSNSFERV